MMMNKEEGKGRMCDGGNMIQKKNNSFVCAYCFVRHTTRHGLRQTDLANGQDNILLVRLFCVKNVTVNKMSSSLILYYYLFKP